MIHESNQRFSAFDTLTLVLSIVLVATIVIPILNHRVDQQYAEIAQRQAEEWSQKILQNEISSEGRMVTQKRGLASTEEGNSSSGLEVGTDPWGRPFKYYYIRNAYGQPVYVAVWSAGPNSKNETSENNLMIRHDGGLSVNFSGDDVGFVRALR